MEKKEKNQNSAGTNPSCARDNVTWGHPGTSRILIGVEGGKQKRGCEPWL